MTACQSLSNLLQRLILTPPPPQNEGERAHLPLPMSTYGIKHPLCLSLPSHVHCKRLFGVSPRRCNLAPVQEYSQDVGMKTDLVTMNPSVIQRAFEDLVNETWREKLLQRLHSLNGSILWIPAFMAKGGKERVEWVNELILKHHINVRTAYPSLRLLHAVRG